MSVIIVVCRRMTFQAGVNAVRASLRLKKINTIDSFADENGRVTIDGVELDPDVADPEAAASAAEATAAKAAREALAAATAAAAALAAAATSAAAAAAEREKMRRGLIDHDPYAYRPPYHAPRYLVKSRCALLCGSILFAGHELIIPPASLGYLTSTVAL